MKNKKTEDIVCSSHGFLSLGPVYCFTNENISSSMRVLAIPRGGRVLTVGASGDHMFEAYLSGASHVDTFDINLNQRHIIELKNHMIRNLPYEDFMDFFFSKLHFFDKDIIKPIYPKFSDGLKSYLAWVDRATCTQAFKFSGTHNPGFDVKNISYVSDKGSYDRLKSILPDQISFVQSDICGLTANFNEKYDVIILSNIFDYMYSDEPLVENRYVQFFKGVLSPLVRQNLNSNLGKISFRYIWDTGGLVWSNFMSYFEERYVRRCGMNKDIEMSAHYIPSGLRDCKQDALLVLRRRTR
ncbi:MAG: DUF3419 family protein [Alphaproteobacteria bacterium]|nr:DUF3419 family protein [Alphaproteobacteria bacterium]